MGAVGWQEQLQETDGSVRLRFLLVRFGSAGRF